MNERGDGSRSDGRVGVAVPAAGSGTRMGGVRKAFLEIAGRPMLTHALRPFLGDPRVVCVVVALAADDAESPPEWLMELDERIRIVVGGDTRSQSVRRALQAMPEDVDVIAVHDAARPLVSTETVTECFDVAMSGLGAVAGCPTVDTMKRVNSEYRIVETPDRSSLWRAQTPQVFPASVLRAAYADDSLEGTDDAALVEKTGQAVRVVDAGPWNIKVTHPQDIVVAAAVLMHRLETA